MVIKDLKKDDFTRVCAITTRPPDVHYGYDYFVKPHDDVQGCTGLVTVYTAKKEWLTLAHTKDFYIYDAEDV